ncbi:uncharacterized protein UV8b_02609 [Ustilaginoidea virens]|uniref:WSC domain-containing protein n=1 Tax=Ustilaginoidea virens TaxID=1159556 RepID=A0A8E5HN82_USTVR|nr:uncharacterized protein UV8b_02609 [Ustilaginoidea virens]QUC18368.1 hypothetical protein UV8b_02609 [Ustilaginoidea virens]
MLVPLLALAPAALALSTHSSSTYSYYGCYAETTQVEGSDHSRALAGGVNQVEPDMTIPKCLDFCSRGTNYRYAGLEWSKECWCSQSLSGIAARLDDGQCDFPCGGNNSLACGGSLKLSVYKRSGAAGASAPLALLLGGLAGAVCL